jgi:hypothetical protein
VRRPRMSSGIRRSIDVRGAPRDNPAFTADPLRARRLRRLALPTRIASYASSPRSRRRRHDPALRRREGRLGGRLRRVPSSRAAACSWRSEKPAGSRPWHRMCRGNAMEAGPPCRRRRVCRVSVFGAVARAGNKRVRVATSRRSMTRTSPKQRRGGHKCWSVASRSKIVWFETWHES